MNKYDETITYYLERELNNRFKCDVIEVVNAGMSGYTVEQEFIFIQLVLQYYEPDVIIGLDGFNDLNSFYVNKDIDLGYLPQYWKCFQVVQKGKEERRFYHRFKAMFKNTARAVDFFQRVITGRQKQIQDYSHITDAELKNLGLTYIDILNDTRDFCSSKGIVYYSFLQPVKWYAPRFPEHGRFCPEECLNKLYGIYDEKIKGLDYGCSLTSVFGDALGDYTDNVHLNPEGNLIVARAMADFLEKKLAKDSKFRTLLGDSSR